MLRNVCGLLLDQRIANEKIICMFCIQYQKLLYFYIVYESFSQHDLFPGYIFKKGKAIQNNVNILYHYKNYISVCVFLDIYQACLGSSKIFVYKTLTKVFKNPGLNPETLWQFIQTCQRLLLNL